MTRTVLCALLLAGCGGVDTRAPGTEGQAPATPIAMAAGGARPADSVCLPYGPDTVSITGRLERRMFYGAPNYGENPESDAREWGFYVVPDAPLCTRAGAELSDEARQGVELVQMVLDSAGYARHRPHLGRRVRATGRLFGAHTGHHHAPILMQVHSIHPTDPPR